MTGRTMINLASISLLVSLLEYLFTSFFVGCNTIHMQVVQPQS